MEQVELLEKARKKLGVKTDYALAKALGIPNNRISDYLKGSRALDEYAMFKLADVLEEEPVKIMARVLAENARTEDKRLFFKRYFSIAGLWIVLGVLSVGYSTSSGNALAGGNVAESPAVSHNPSLCEVACNISRNSYSLQLVVSDLFLEIEK
jgi:transcriptional regulator with XRE-family HTH domain